MTTRYIRLKNPGSFSDPETTFCISGDEIQPFPERLGRLTQEWIRAGGLVLCNAQGGPVDEKVDISKHALGNPENLSLPESIYDAMLALPGNFVDHISAAVAGFANVPAKTTQRTVTNESHVSFRVYLSNSISGILDCNAGAGGFVIDACEWYLRQRASE